MPFVFPEVHFYFVCLFVLFRILFILLIFIIKQDIQAVNMCLYKKSSLSTWSVVYLRSVPPNRPASLPPPPWRTPQSTLSSSPSTQSRSRYTLSRDVPTTSGRRRRWRSSARERTSVGHGWKRSRRPSPAPVSQTSLWLVDKIEAALSSPGKSNKSVIGG